MDESAADWISLHEAAARYDLTYDRLYKLFIRGTVRGRRGPDRTILLERASLEDWFPPPGWDWLHEARERHGLADMSLLYTLTTRATFGLQAMAGLSSGICATAPTSSTRQPTG